MVGKCAFAWVSFPASWIFLQSVTTNARSLLSALLLASAVKNSQVPISFGEFHKKYTLCGRVSVVFILYTLILLSCLLSYFD